MQHRSRCKHLLVQLHATRRSSGRKLTPAVLLHVQDEAELRRLSEDRRDGPSVPRRGRASKVQVNVVDFIVGGERVHVPQALVPLANKTARTLATCFMRVLDDFCGSVLPEPAEQPTVWLVHVLVGDGIATNELAARYLLAQKQPLVVGRCRYFRCS